MSGFRNILPQTSEAEHKTNCLFASVGAKAIQNGFFARETRGTPLRWLIVETNDYENPTIGPYKAVRIWSTIRESMSFKFSSAQYTVER